MGIKILRSKISWKIVNRRRGGISLVFLHGSTMTKEGMEPFAKKFKNYNCVVMDLTAHGQSKGEEPKDIAGFAADIEATIRYLKDIKILTGQVVLLGYSMGGAIACEIAIRKKINLSGLVILSSGGDLSSNTPLVDGLKELPEEQFKTGDILEYLFGIDTCEVVKNKIKRLFMETKVDDKIGYKDLMVSNAYNHLELCAKIKVPTYIVHGSADQIVLPNAAIETCNAIKNSQILIVPRKGHAAIYEATDYIVRNICKFIYKI